MGRVARLAGGRGRVLEGGPVLRVHGGRPDGARGLTGQM
jgi:hypothetical protein